MGRSRIPSLSPHLKNALCPFDKSTKNSNASTQLSQSAGCRRLLTIYRFLYIRRTWNASRSVGKGDRNQPTCPQRHDGILRTAGKARSLPAWDRSEYRRRTQCPITLSSTWYSTAISMAWNWITTCDYSPIWEFLDEDHFSAKRN